MTEIINSKRRRVFVIDGKKFSGYLDLHQGRHWWLALRLRGRQPARFNDTFGASWWDRKEIPVAFRYKGRSRTGRAVVTKMHDGYYELIGIGKLKAA